MPVVAARIAVPSNKESLDAALEGLVRLNMAIIRQAAAAGKPLPNPLKSKVRWRPDGWKGGPNETWDTWDICVRRGYGDCEDLGAATAAYLRLDGTNASAVVRSSNSPGVAWHCIVELPDGRQVDPSAQMGMHEYYRDQKKNIAGRRRLASDLAVVGGIADNLQMPHTATILRGLASALTQKR